METRQVVRKNKTVRIWQEAVASLRTQTDDPHAQVMADAIEAAIVAAAANSNCSVDLLPYNLPGQMLSVDLPTSA